MSQIIILSFKSCWHLTEFRSLLLRSFDVFSIPAESWPRIVRPVSTPSRCAHLQLCTPSGHLEYSAITAAKHGRSVSHVCLRAQVSSTPLLLVCCLSSDTRGSMSSQCRGGGRGGKGGVACLAPLETRFIWGCWWKGTVWRRRHSYLEL